MGSIHNGGAYLSVLLLTFISFALSFLFRFVLLYLDLLPQEIYQYNSYHILMLLLGQALIFMIIFRSFLPKGYFTLSMFKKPPKASLFIKSLFGLFFMNFSISLLFKLFDVEVKQYEQFNKNLLREASIIFLLSVSLISPLYEEFIFRGVLLKFLSSNQDDHQKWEWQNIIAYTFPILFSSVLFTILHFDLDASLPIFFIAIYFSLLTIYTGSITLTCILHSMQNLIAGLAFLLVDIDLSTLLRD